MAFTLLAKAASPSAGLFDISPVAAPPPLTNLISDLQWNNLIDILDGIAVDKISAASIAGGLVSDTEFDFLNGLTQNIETNLNLKELSANKGAVSGYAGLDASQKLLLTNFPAGTGLQILRRNTGNTALEFFTLTSTLDGLTDTTITAAAAHEVLVRNAGNTAWVNELIDNDNLAAGRFANITGVSDSFSLLTDNTRATLELEANHTVPGIGDSVGVIDFWDDNSIGTRTLFGRIETTIRDPTNLAEDGRMDFQVQSNSTLVTLLRVDGDSDTVEVFANLNMTNNAIHFASDTTSPPLNSEMWIANEFGTLWSNVGNGSQHDFAVGGTSEFTIQAGEFDMKDNEIKTARNIQFSGSGTLPSSFLQYIQYNNTPGSMLINVQTAKDVRITVDAVDQFVFTENDLTMSGGLNLLMNANGANGYIDLDEITTPATPAANHGRLYAKDVAAVAHIFFIDQAGLETDLMAVPAVDIIQEGNSSIEVVDAGTGAITTTLDGTAVILSDLIGTEMSHRFATAEGTATLVSSNRLIWPNDGNFIQSGGTNGTLDLIRTTDWQSGAQIQLRFNAFATNDLIHQATISGADHPLFLQNRENHVDVSTDDVFSFMWDSGVSEWKEIWNTLPKVYAPASATDNAIARWDVTRSRIQNSGVIVDDSDNLTGLGTLNTHTLPGGTDTIALIAAAQALTNKTIDGDLNTILDINETQQNVSVGAAATVLTSNGVGLAPTYQTAPGGEVFTWTADHSAARFNLENTGAIDFDLTGPTVTPAATQPYIAYDIAPTPDAMRINVPANRTMFFSVGGVDQMEITDSIVDLIGNNLDNVAIFTSNAGTPATTGVIRLGSTEEITWKGTGNNSIHFNGSDVFTIEITNGTDYTFSETAFDVNANSLTDAAALGMTASGATLGNAVNNIFSNASGMTFNIIANDSFFMTINGVQEYQFSNSAFTIAEANNIVLGTTTGTKIGTATTQKIGFFNATPVVQQTALTTQLTSITHTAPGTPDYAIQALTSTTPFGFVTKDEGETLLSVVLNLQVRVQELEDKLQALGFIA